MAAKRPAIMEGDRIVCPYCGRKGEVARIYPDKSMMIVHEIIEKRVRPTLKVKVLNDSCWRGIERRRKGQLLIHDNAQISEPTPEANGWHESLVK